MHTLLARMAAFDRDQAKTSNMFLPADVVGVVGAAHGVDVVALHEEDVPARRGTKAEAVDSWVPDLVNHCNQASCECGYKRMQKTQHAETDMEEDQANCGNEP